MISTSQNLHPIESITEISIHVFSFNKESNMSLHQPQYLIKDNTHSTVIHSALIENLNQGNGIP